MPFDKRNCLLKGERENYTRMACVVNYIYDSAIQNCSCIPWDLVPYKKEKQPSCKFSGYKCFRIVVNYLKENNLDKICPILCTTTQYTITKSIEHQTSATQYGEDFMTFLYQNPKWMLREDMNEILKLTMSNVKDSYLTKTAKRYSMVQIFFQNPQMTLITKDAKVTVADMVSNIGGTIGIFLGLSIISILEIAIELVILAKKYFTSKNLQAS